MMSKNRMRRAYYAVCALAAVGVISSCDSYPFGPPAWNVVTLDEAAGTASVSYSPEDGELRVSGDAAILDQVAVGSVIASGPRPGMPDGMLALVTAVDQEGGTTVLQTESVRLASVVGSGVLEVSKDLTGDDLASEPRMGEGATLAEAEGEAAFVLELADVVLHDQDGLAETTDDRVTVSGTVAISPAFDLRVVFSWLTATEVTFVNRTALETSLSVRSGASANGPAAETVIAELSFAPITEYVDGIPVVLRPVLVVSVNVDGQVRVGFEAASDQRVTYTAGISYLNGKWRPLSDYQTEYNATAPRASEASETDLTVRPELGVLLYGRQTFGSKVKGQSQWTVMPEGLPWWRMYGRLAAELAFDPGRLCANLGEYSSEVISHRRLAGESDGVTTAPFFSPLAQEFSGVLEVGIGCGTPGAKIYYTTDGSAPSVESELYVEPLRIERTTTIMAMAVRTGLSASEVAEATYTRATVAMPALEPPSAEDFVAPLAVTIRCATEGAEIRYALDASEPTEASTLYEGPFDLTYSATVKARAFKAGMTPSGTVLGVYSRAQVATPVFNPPDGTQFAGSTSVAISTGTPEARIYYSLDGSDPDEGDIAYSGPVVLTQTATIRARAYAAGMTPSPIGTASFANIKVATPTINPNGGTHSQSVQVTLACGTTGSEIRYTIDGSEPTTGSTLYAGPFVLSTSGTLKAKAFAPDMAASDTASATFAFTGLESCDITESESNDTMAEANPLGFCDGMGTAAGAVTSETDLKDYYAIELEAGDEVSVWISAEPVAAASAGRAEVIGSYEMMVSLVDAGNSLMAVRPFNYAVTPPQGSFGTIAVQSGTHYVLVEPGPGWTPATYNLTVMRSPRAIAEIEPNDDASQAQTIEGVGGYAIELVGRINAETDGADCFQFDLPTGLVEISILRLRGDFTASGSEGAYAIALHDLNDSMTAAAGLTTGATETSFVTDGQSGHYTLKVHASAGAGDYLVRIAPTASLWTYDEPVSSCTEGIAVSGGYVYTGGYVCHGETPTDFLALKYDLNGTPVWDVTWGGDATDGAYGIAVRGSDVYLAGSTYSYVVGSPDESNSDAVVVHWSNVGALDTSQSEEGYWSRFCGESEYFGVEEARDVAVDEAGEVYTVGYTLDDGDNMWFYVEKCDTGDNDSWVVEIGSDATGEDCLGYGLCLGDSRIYATGCFTSMVSTGDKQLVLWQLDADGTWGWDAFWGSASADEVGRDVAVVGSDLYVVGTFTAMESPTGSAVLVVKFSDDGETYSEVGSATFDGPGDDEGWGIVVDGGFVYVTGTVTLDGQTNALLLTYDTNLNLLTSSCSGGMAPDAAYDAACSGGSLYMTGQMNGRAFVRKVADPVP
ncbi:MAG: hypothetical protein GXY33_01335 [Phycisphaerae bacterium]|nr:hypothetical protein [Phycisphaerae bacterium]